MLDNVNDLLHNVFVDNEERKTKMNIEFSNNIEDAKIKTKDIVVSYSNENNNESLEKKLRESQKIIFDIIDIVKNKYKLEAILFKHLDSLFTFSVKTTGHNYKSCEMRIYYSFSDMTIFSKSIEIRSQSLKENNIDEQEIINNFNKVSIDEDIINSIKQITSNFK